MNISRPSGKDRCGISLVSWLCAWIQALNNQWRAFSHEAWVPFHNMHVKDEYLPVEEARHELAIAAFEPFIVCFIKL